MPEAPSIAWNGISLDAPPEWEPSILERDFMRLEQDGRPVAELKWRRVQGRFSARKHIRKLDRAFGRADIREASPGPAWIEAAESLRASGLGVTLLEWEDSVGAVLHSPATGLAVLAQFPRPVAGAPVLASLRDHWGGATMPWRLFGIRARVPSDFLLDTFRFHPGRYGLEFRRPKRSVSVDARPGDFRRGPGASLVLERHAPADAMLAKQGFETWIEENYRKVIVGTETKDTNMIYWKGIQKRFLRFSLRHQGRVWRDPAANAVFAVYAHGEQDIAEATFNQICNDYGAV
ncbi:hypothetical protein [Salidesulfovibrio onnuriiensis]|uniref:hypothetical protein n=1 Tax=Salidesulfovibrio onnuriiensis TaxID=2583823 RepID=UPI0011C8DB88|nr:hypothetical protein [Salidesulfovibrio onnuriiensis]